MVEVFKTNVDDPQMAALLLERIHASFKTCRANFDLEDCDRILRIHSPEDILDTDRLISLLKTLNCQAEILSDELSENVPDKGFLKE